MLTVALDITLTPELQEEGYARELINRIQNFRKDSQLDVVDTITIELESHTELDSAFKRFEEYIKTETLCTQIIITEKLSQSLKTTFEIADNIEIEVSIQKNN